MESKDETEKPFQHEDAGWNPSCLCSEREPLPSGTGCCSVRAEMLLSVRLPMAGEHTAAFTAVSETNRPLLLRLATEVKN